MVLLDISLVKDKTLRKELRGMARRLWSPRDNCCTSSSVPCSMSRVIYRGTRQKHKEQNTAHERIKRSCGKVSTSSISSMSLRFSSHLRETKGHRGPKRKIPQFNYVAHALLCSRGLPHCRSLFPPPRLQTVAKPKWRKSCECKGNVSKTLGSLYA